MVVDPLNLKKIIHKLTDRGTTLLDLFGGSARKISIKLFTTLSVASLKLSYVG